MINCYNQNYMPNQIQRSSTARIVSIVVLFGVIPVWFFYIGIRYKETIDSLDNNNENLQVYLNK